MTTKTSKDIRIISLSDLHLGHRRVLAPQMIAALNARLKDLSGVDFLFLCGDVFDAGLQLSDDDVIQIQEWIRSLLLRCASYGVRLRILEGTPSHDRKQSKQFVLINDTIEYERRADLKYVDTLSIIREEEFGIDILYVPDEWSSSCADTYKQVLDLMSFHNIDHVHFALMHGNFKYQIPAIAHLDAHIERNYLDIVKYYIFIGHVHTMSTYERILAHGSFNRHNHGEEEDKGLFDVTISHDGPDKITFVVNELATIFKTIDTLGMTADEATVLLNEWVNKLPADSRLSVLVSRDSVMRGVYSSFSRAYPEFTWQVKSEKASKVSNDKVIKTIAAVVLNHRTLSGLLAEKMKENGVSDLSIEESLALIPICE